MSAFFVAVSLVIGGVVLMALAAVVRGPTAYDRILATSLAVVNTVAMLLTLGFAFDRPEFFFDLGLGYALLGFVFPLAFAHYLHRERA